MGKPVSILGFKEHFKKLLFDPDLAS